MGPIGYAFVGSTLGLILGIAQHYICTKTETRLSQWVLPGIVLIADALLYMCLITIAICHNYPFRWALYAIAIISCIPVLATGGVFIGWYVYRIGGKKK